MKKSIFLFFAAILCAMTANAYNQAAKDLYFDNSEAKWEKCYVYIGKGDYTSCYDMTRVTGTQYLWQLPANFNGGSAWNGATGWVVCKEKWWASANETIDKYIWHGDNNVTKKSTSAWVDTKIYKTNGAANATSDGTTKKVYTVTSYTKSNYTVTINTVEGGTLTVNDYDDNAVANGASKIHLTVLKFSAAPASGYVLEGVQINDGSTTTTISASEINTKTHTLTSNVTITPVWKATTSTVTVTATATNGTVAGGGVVEEGTSVTLTATPNAGYQFVNWTVGGAEVSTANPYIFTAEEDVTVVANFEETPKATIYFVNNSGWSKIQAYAWGDKGTNASWAGVDITANKLSEKIGEFDVYSYTVEQGLYANVIFNNGSAQTKDYVWIDGNYYWNSEATGFEGGTKADAETKFSVPVEYDYVYFINTNSWAAVNIYTWESEIATWPGVAMNKEAEQIAGFDVYSHKEVKGTTFGGMKFNEGKDKAETGNLTWQAGKYYAPSKDKWYDTKEAAAEALAAPVVDVYTVVGSENLFGSAWAPSAEANDMEKQDDGSYKKVYSNVELTSSVQWKIAKNDNWWEGPTFNANNNTLSIAKSGIYNVTFVLSADLATATAEAELLEETNTVADCYISGNAALTDGAGWAGNEFKMDYDPATETYSYTLTGLVTDEAYELKVVLGGVWYTYANLASIPTGVTEGNDHSIAFKMAAAGDVVVTYNVEAGITLSGDFAEPAPEVPVTLYFVNAENWTNLKAHIWIDPSGVSYKPWEESESLTDTGNDHNGADIYSYTFSNKYNRIIWKGDDAKQTTNDVATYDVAKPYYYKGVWYASLSEIPAPVEDYYTIAGATAITGVNWDPANEDNKMTKDGEVYTLTKTGLQLEADDYEYKVAKNGKWGDGEYPNGSNQKVTITENGVYTIVYTYTVGTSLTAEPTKTGDYTPDKPVYTVAGDAALCGTNWNAGDTDNDMSDNGDGTFTWTKTGVKLTGDAGFKVVKNHDFGTAYPTDNWVINIANYEGAAIYTVTITFTESSKDIAVTLTKTGDAAPAVISYVLMGVNGDWTNGIALTQDPGNADQYVLENQVIIKATDAVKVVTLTDGTASAWCGNVDTWSNATYAADGDGNIVLEDGIYTFYFKKSTDNIYINQTGYARNVTNKYGTICLPYAAESTTGAIFYRVAGKETGKVYLESVDALEAGVPYIFEKTANQIKVVYTGEKETTAGSANGLVGTFADNTTVPNDAYILYGGEFRTNNDPTKPNNKINAYRAYLDLSDVDGGKPQPMPGRRYIGMDVQGENEATGVEDIFSTDAPVKVIENGQLIIIRDGVKYNVQGQKL